MAHAKIAIKRLANIGTLRLFCIPKVWFELLYRFRFETPNWEENCEYYMSAFGRWLCWSEKLCTRLVINLNPLPSDFITGPTHFFHVGPLAHSKNRILDSIQRRNDARDDDQPPVCGLFGLGRNWLSFWTKKNGFFNFYSLSHLLFFFRTSPNHSKNPFWIPQKINVRWAGQFICRFISRLSKWANASQLWFVSCHVREDDYEKTADQGD